MTQRSLPENARLIPDTAELVFKGYLFDVYQWQQEMFNGTYETFEMLRRPDTVMILALDGDTVVTIDEQQPGGIMRKNHLPVGRVDESDVSVEAAARRELMEETGLIFRNWRLIDVFQPEAKIEWFVHTFVATDLLKTVAPSLDPGEKIIVKRSSFDEIRPQSLRYSKVIAAAKTLSDII